MSSAQIHQGLIGGAESDYNRHGHIPMFGKPFNKNPLAILAERMFFAGGKVGHPQHFTSDSRQRQDGSRPATQMPIKIIPRNRKSAGYIPFSPGIALFS